MRGPVMSLVEESEMIEVGGGEKQVVAVKAVAMVRVMRKKFMERMKEMMMIHLLDSTQRGVLLQLVSTQLDPSKLMV